MPEKKDLIDPLAQYPTLAKIHAVYPHVQLTLAAPLVLETTEEMAKFMSECSMWVAETTNNPTLRECPQLTVTIHVAFWLASLSDQRRIEEWTQAVEGIGQYISGWQASLFRRN